MVGRTDVHPKRYFALKGQFYEKSSWAEMVPPTLHSNELKDFFNISKIAKIFGQKVGLPTF